MSYAHHHDPDALPDQPWTERKEHRAPADLTHRWVRLGLREPERRRDTTSAYLIRTNHDHLAVVRRVRQHVDQRS